MEGGTQAGAEARLLAPLGGLLAMRLLPCVRSPCLEGRTACACASCLEGQTMCSCSPCSEGRTACSASWLSKAHGQHPFPHPTPIPAPPSIFTPCVQRHVCVPVRGVLVRRNACVWVCFLHWGGGGEGLLLVPATRGCEGSDPISGSGTRLEGGERFAAGASSTCLL